MRRTSILSIILLVVFVTVFFWAQYKILQARQGYRIEEKILMLTDRPEVTKIAALGFDNAVADLMWIRAIQYFGGNFSSLKDPDKREGLVNLFDNMVALDPQFTDAWKFGGFVFNESMNDTQLAIDFLLRGAAENPDAWRLTFDAGFIAFYNLENYSLAKQLFIQSAYGENIAYYFTPRVEANIIEGAPETMIDMDPESDVVFQADNAEVFFETDQPTPIGLLSIEHRKGKQQTLHIGYADLDEPQKFHDLDEITFSISSFVQSQKEVITQKLKFDRFSTKDESGNASIAEVRIYGASNPSTPGYVLRMAFEMDTKAGRFLASWEQNYRYYVEAKEVGDQISADIAAEKLSATYSSKCFELLEEAVTIYRERNGKLPSTRMFELVESGILPDVLNQKIQEDPQFKNQVLPVLMPNGHIMELMTTFDGQHPHLLITYENEEGEADWYIASRKMLLKKQTNNINKLQEAVNKFKDLNGELPASLNKLTEEPWFNYPPEILEDPLEGEFVLNKETGEVEAVNPKF
ncbi:hypothetical protein GF373_00430 [bacterium]|nr:hypothetical protein [bacterium]